MKDLVDQLISAGVEQREARKEISILFKEFGQTNPNKIREIVEKRIKTRTPIQYLLGKAYFMDFEVTVSPSVLIPRPETEILVEEAVKRLRGIRCHPEGAKRPKDLLTKEDSFPLTSNSVLTVLDIGTGSGIIPIALCKMIKDIKVIAIDIKDDIIELAKKNAKKNGVENKIGFKVCDLFSNNIKELLESNKFDLVISNPPYVKQSEMQKLCSGEVTLPLRPELLHEPRIALVGSKDNVTGLVYYERVIELVKCYPCRLLALEIDPPLVNDLNNLLKKERLTKFEIVKDYGGLGRCLFICL